MPGMCGQELVRKIAWMCPRTAVVLMSADIASGTLPEGAAFIGKPFLVQDLYSVVEKKLEPPGGGESGNRLRNSEENSSPA
jgi:FixJ family two-component response regulator